MRVRFFYIVILFGLVFPATTMFSQKFPFRTYTVDDGLGQSRAYSVIQDSNGYLWIGTQDGVSKFDGLEFKTYTTAEGLVNNRVLAMTRDDELNIWLGTAGGVTIIHEDVFGNMWIGTDGEGVYVNQNEDIKNYSIGNNKIYAIYADGDSAVWIGTYGRGLYKFSNGNFVNYSALNGLANSVIRSIMKDRDGNMLFGTYGGLTYLRNEMIAYYTVEHGLTNDIILAITNDRDGTLWLGTYGGGITLLRNGEFKSFTSENGLLHDVVRTITTDSDGTLWIATDGGGCSVYDGNRFQNITTADGLSNNVCYFVLEDDYDNYWIGTNKGLNRYNPESGLFRVYTTQQGLPSNEMNTSAAYKDENGYLWFGTVKGVVRIDPGGEKPNLAPPPVYITKVQVFEEEYSVKDTLLLGNNENYLKFEFIGLNFTANGRTTYRYMLVGIDNDWQESNNRHVQYTSLAPGDYAFKVMAGNGIGIWSESPAEFYFTIRPPYWATWWFRTLVISVVLVLLYYSRITTLKKIRRRQDEFSKRLINSQEQERKRIAAELHDSLGQNLLIIKNRALLGLRDSDGDSVTEQLNEISDIASHTIDEVREISYNLRPYQLDRLGLKKAIESMIEKVNSTTPIRCSVSIDPLERNFPKDVETGIYRIIQECLNNIVKHSGAQEAMVVAQKASRELIMTIRDDGKGFEFDDGGLLSRSVEGFGLRGIAERVKILRGTLTIDSNPGKGTKIIIKIPVTALNTE